MRRHGSIATVRTVSITSRVAHEPLTVIGGDVIEVMASVRRCSARMSRAWRAPIVMRDPWLSVRDARRVPDGACAAQAVLSTAPMAIDRGEGQQPQTARRATTFSFARPGVGHQNVYTHRVLLSDMLRAARA